jgi:hypothetical protein
MSDAKTRSANLERMLKNILRDVQQRHPKLSIEFTFSQTVGNKPTAQFKVRYEKQEDRKIVNKANKMLKRELAKIDIGTPWVKNIGTGSDVFLTLSTPSIMRAPMLAKTIAHLVEAGHEDLAEQLTEVVAAPPRAFLHLPAEAEGKVTEAYLKMTSVKSALDAMHEIPKDLMPLYKETNKAMDLLGKAKDSVYQARMLARKMFRKMGG